MRLPWDSQEKARRDEQRAAGVYVRVRSADEYHSARWTRVSKTWRRLHPLCEECRKKGIITEGQVTDHIIPWPVCKDFFDDRNFQTLCEKCNHEKGQHDKEIIRQWKSSHPEQTNSSE